MYSNKLNFTSVHRQSPNKPNKSMKSTVNSWRKMGHEPTISLSCSDSSSLHAEAMQGDWMYCSGMQHAQCTSRGCVHRAVQGWSCVP